MRVFFDTSGLYAVMDRRDRYHLRARKIWQQLLHDRSILITSNYVLLETHSLLQSRLGLEAARTLHTDIVPVLSIEWIDEAQHERAIDALLASNQRRLSLVDCSSFVVCRDTGTDSVFTFDPHFERAGFRVVV